MPTMGACGSTFKQGDPATEVEGIQQWDFDEVAKNTEYADNTTDCGTADQTGPKTISGTLIHNLQSDDANKGRPVYRAGEEVTDCEFHIDSTDSNYWAGTIKIISLSGYVFNHESSDPIRVTYNWKAQGTLTGNGTLASS